MPHWNYRATQDENGYCVREVYYNDKGEPDGWTDALCGYYETYSELVRALELMHSDAQNRGLLNLTKK